MEAVQRLSFRSPLKDSTSVFITTTLSSLHFLIFIKSKPRCITLYITWNISVEFQRSHQGLLRHAKSPFHSPCAKDSVKDLSLYKSSRTGAIYCSEYSNSSCNLRAVPTEILIVFSEHVKWHPHVVVYSEESQ